MSDRCIPSSDRAPRTALGFGLLLAIAGLCGTAPMSPSECAAPITLVSEPSDSILILADSLVPNSVAGVTRHGEIARHPGHGLRFDIRSDAMIAVWTCLDCGSNDSLGSFGSDRIEKLVPLAATGRRSYADHESGARVVILSDSPRAYLPAPKRQTGRLHVTWVAYGRSARVASQVASRRETITWGPSTARLPSEDRPTRGDLQDARVIGEAMVDLATRRIVRVRSER